MRLVDDQTWAVLTIYGEARGEPFDGKVGVAEVIRNRADGRYNNPHGGVAGAVLAPLQFSAWNDNDPNRMVMATVERESDVIAECRRAWAEAVGGSDRTRGAVLYCNLAKRRPGWVDRCRETVRLGRHTFFVPL